MNKVRELYPSIPNPILCNQLVTVADLQIFKTEILVGIQQLLSDNKPQNSKKWLKSYEVKKMLGISSSTLQTLRNGGTLPYTKVGGIIYYDRDNIDHLLSGKTRLFSSEMANSKL